MKQKYHKDSLKSLRNSRRALLLGAMGALLSPVANAQLSLLKNKHLIQAIPVLPWLQVGQSTLQSITPTVQSIASASQQILMKEGVSEITGGQVLSLTSIVGAGLMGESGLRLMSSVFDGSQKLQLVIWVVEKGWEDKYVDPLIKRITSRYKSMAKPVNLQDGDDEASDYYVFFEMGKFVIEIAVPQFGSFVTIHFTTKEIHKKLRSADGSYHIFDGYLKKMEQMG